MTDLLNVSNKEAQKTGGFDFTKLILPGSILLAALLVSGTLLYTRGATPGAQIPNQNASVLTVENFKEWAKDFKLDTKQFNECIDSSKYKDEIAKDIQDGSTNGVSGTPTFFVNGRKVVGAQPFSVFKSVIEAELAGKTVEGASDDPNSTISLTKYPVSPDDDPVLGNEAARISVIEFSDFECPFCRRFFTDTFDQLKKEYIDTGKIKLIYRDYPLTSIHPAAEISAQAAQCANEQGKFWEMHDKIFEEQG